MNSTMHLKGTLILIISRISKCCVAVELFSSLADGPKKFALKMIYTFAKSHDPIVLREKPRVTCKGLLENKHERTSGCYIWPSTGTCRFSSLCVAFYIVLHCAVSGSVCTHLGLNHTV